MDIKVSEIWKAMLSAATSSLGKDWSKVRVYAEPELKRLAKTLVDIGKQSVSGEITKGEAKALLKIHRNATQNVLLAAEGMSILAVEKAVNAAMAAVKAPITAAFGGIL
jgi:hypothetical protein